MLSLYTIRLESSPPNSLLKGFFMSSRNGFFTTNTMSDNKYYRTNICTNSGFVNQSRTFGHGNGLSLIPAASLSSPATSFTSVYSTTSGHAWIDRVVERVYSNWQAHDRTEHELKTITLRFVSIAKKQIPTLDWASVLAVGTTFSKWVHYTKTREEHMASELLRCVPDYDPTVPKKSPQSSKVAKKDEEIA